MNVTDSQPRTQLLNNIILIGARLDPIKVISFLLDGDVVTSHYTSADVVALAVGLSVGVTLLSALVFTGCLTCVYKRRTKQNIESDLTRYYSNAKTSCLHIVLMIFAGTPTRMERLQLILTMSIQMIEMKVKISNSQIPTKNPMPAYFLQSLCHMQTL